MNRCAECGRFAAWSELALYEANSLDLHGNLSQEWWWYHKNGCPR